MNCNTGLEFQETMQIVPRDHHAYYTGCLHIKLIHLPYSQVPLLLINKVIVALLIQHVYTDNDVAMFMLYSQ